MKFIFSSYFRKAYKKLPKEIQQNFHKKILILSQDSRHPSLRIKKLKDAKVWAGSITMNYRFTFIKAKNSFIFINIGTHDII